MLQNMESKNPFRFVLSFAVPVFIGNLYQQIYNILEIFIAGSFVGKNAIAVVGSVTQVYLLLLAIIYNFINGITVITAQRFGASDYNGVRKSVTHCIMASTVLCLALSLLVGVFVDDILQLMNVPDAIMAESKKYISVLNAGLIFTTLYYLCSALIKALGNSLIPFVYLLISTTVNIVITFSLMSYFKLGIVGSAFGIVGSALFTVIAYFVYIYKKIGILHLCKQDWQFDAAFMKQHLHIGIPMSCQLMLLSFGTVIMQAICNSFGTDFIVAYTGATRIDYLVIQPIYAIGVMMSVYTAQNYGTGNIKQIYKGVKFITWVAIVASLVLSVLVYNGNKLLIDWIIKDSNSVIEYYARMSLQISSIFYVFLGLIYLYRNTLQGIGKAYMVVMATICELSARFVVAWYVIINDCPELLLYALPLGWLCGGITFMVIYYRYISNKNLQFGLNKCNDQIGFVNL